MGKRPRVPGGRERTQREDELQRQVEDDSAQCPVVRAKKAPSALSMDVWDGHLAAFQAEYRGWCPFCVAGNGKSEAHRRIEASRDRGHPELHLDCCYMGREAEDRASPILVGQFSKDVWLVTHPVNDVIMSVVIKFDQEASILDVKNALMMKSRDTQGFKVMPEESQVGASAANAMVERSVWEMQSTARSLIAYAEWVQNTTFELGSAIWA